MTRPASFNKIWGYEALQIADENNEKTQEFMRSGWEGGSDKKAPSASVQNYHMQKTDQALQEVERQGYLSWRSDVPYSKGARVFFHGSTFHALKDNQDVEPQGSRDNNVWYLIPVQVYPTRYDRVEGLGTAATSAAQTNTSVWAQDANSDALVKERTLASVISWANGWFTGLGTASTRNVFFGGGKSIEDFPYDSSLLSDMDAICVLRDSLVSRINKKQDISALGTAAYSNVQTNVNIDDQDWKSEALVKEKTIALFRDYLQAIVSKYGSVVTQNVFHGKSKDSIWDYPYDSSLAPDMDAISSLRDGLNNLILDIKNSLKGGAHAEIQSNANIWSQEYGKGRLALEETVAGLRDWSYGNLVGKVRIIDAGAGTMYPGAMYGDNAGEVITRLQIKGQVTGSDANQISVGTLQYLIAGNWITVERVKP